MNTARFWYQLLLPKMTLFGLFIVLPTMLALFIAMSHVTPGHLTWVGLKNFSDVVRDRTFWTSVRNTLIYTVVTTPVVIGTAFILSNLLMTLPDFWRSVFRAVFYLPSVTAVVVMALVWAWIYDDSSGLLNGLLRAVHLHGIGWLVNPHLALWSIMLMTILTPPGMGIVLYMSQLGSIPAGYYEAAELDGAGTWAKFRYITWPMVMPTTLYLAVMHTIAAFQIFTAIYVMTGGGPGNATLTIVGEIYDKGFQYFELGHAGAEAILLGLVIAIFSYVQFKVLGRHVEY
ncbi:carbohydrate ABC transporter permease [Sulfobacillus thermosulfidooxidans]|uniref:carbohydrate ABC transporter permease n=1 Tax=Sulfobacillus thermosulfidooxidans TaxID=28034 RepID=UPI0006B679C6|nr:sugar ABC transporter permease [Sulfobacillus thermosulfidooxidans]